jgi:hypothetical protein
MPITEQEAQIMMMRLERNKKRDPSPPPGYAPCQDESDLQDKCVAYCHSRGWWVMFSRMDLATTTPVGSPDLIIFADGSRVFIVEAKAAKEKLRPAQLGVKVKLESLGHTVHVCRSVPEFMDVLYQGKFSQSAS